jgi:hypothetical protein
MANLGYQNKDSSILFVTDLESCKMKDLVEEFYHHEQNIDLFEEQKEEQPISKKAKIMSPSKQAETKGVVNLNDLKELGNVAIDDILEWRAYDGKLENLSKYHQFKKGMNKDSEKKEQEEKLNKSVKSDEISSENS